MKAFLISLAAVLVQSITFGLVPNDGYSTEVLFVEVQTIESDNECGNVKVTIKADGEVVDQFETKKKGKFQYYFDANTYYEVLFEKEGYITKRVKINTYTGKLKNSIHEFNFYVEMAQGPEEQNDDIVDIYVPKNGKKFTYAKL